MDIHDRAPDWDQRPEDERADFALEWEAIVGRLQGVIEKDAVDGLTLEQRFRLHDLALRLVEARHVIARIGLDYPDLRHLLADIPMSGDERIAHEINALRHWAGLLRSVSDYWDSALLANGEKQAFPWEWGLMVGRFEEVTELALRGALRPAERAALRDVADWLSELLPTMQKLKLRQPDPDALARARAVEAA
jgi:hypothetical protein